MDHDTLVAELERRQVIVDPDRFENILKKLERLGLIYQIPREKVLFYRRTY